MPTHFILLDIIRLIIRTNDAIILYCLGYYTALVIITAQRYDVILVVESPFLYIFFLIELNADSYEIHMTYHF